MILQMVAQNKNKGRGSRDRTKRRGGRRNARPGEFSTTQTPPIVRYSPNVFGFPDRLMTKLRYSDVVTNASTSGALATHVFLWNSTYDPNYTDVGHQPLYRDTYANIYDYYAVVRARARVRFDNTNTALGFVIGCTTDDDTSFSPTFQTLMEQAHGVNTTLTPLSGSHSSHEFSLTWDCASVLGIDPYTSQSYKTAVASNPTQISTLGCWSIPIDGSSTGNLQLRVDMEFDVLWTELTTPTQS